MDKQQFIKAVAMYVTKYAPQYGINCNSAVIAQAILESGWGQSKLASTYHNYFGLKCGSKWTGHSVNMATKEEYQPGVVTDIRDNFRVYNDMESGIKGYFEFIQLSRYHNLRGISNPKEYLETIKADGYATSSSYVTNTYAVVEQYNLTQYDYKGGTTVARDRNVILKQAQKWLGRKESDGSHKVIIDTYNGHKPLARGYKVKYTDAWCATFVSAVAIAVGYTDIIPTECGCEEMIKLFQKMGCWVEDDNYTPKPGDVVFYDWDDNGKGDCTGHSDHVGYVEMVVGTNEQIIEGNKNDSVTKRTIQVGGRYIRGYGVPKYTSNGSSNVPSGNKTIEQVAKDVIAGKYGNGDARKKAVEAEGYNYNKVQSKVNEILSGSRPMPVLKDTNTIAKEVIAGKWGNGNERKQALENAGYNYKTIQAKVNELSTTYDVTAVAKDVIAGKYGNGEVRKKNLEAKGYDYNVVQKRVNQLL